MIGLLQSYNHTRMRRWKFQRIGYEIFRDALQGRAIGNHAAIGRVIFQDQRYMLGSCVVFKVIEMLPHKLAYIYRLAFKFHNTTFDSADVQQVGDQVLHVAAEMLNVQYIFGLIRWYISFLHIDETDKTEYIIYGTLQIMRGYIQKIIFIRIKARQLLVHFHQLMPIYFALGNIDYGAAAHRVFA